LASPDLLVEGLEPGAAYIAAVTSINKKVRGLTVGFSTKSLDWPVLTCWWRDSNLGLPTLQPSPLLTKRSVGTARYNYHRISRRQQSKKYAKAYFHKNVLVYAFLDSSAHQIRMA